MKQEAQRPAHESRALQNLGSAGFDPVLKGTRIWIREIGQCQCVKGWREKRGKGLLPLRVGCQPDPSQSVDTFSFHLGVSDLPSVREPGRFLPVLPRNPQTWQRKHLASTYSFDQGRKHGPEPITITKQSPGFYSPSTDIRALPQTSGTIVPTLDIRRLRWGDGVPQSHSAETG